MQSTVLVVRLWAIGLAVLIAATWRLWTPLRWPPRIPAFEALTRLPPAIDGVLLAALLFALLSSVSRPERRGGIATATACLAGLMLFDQLRWQPWAYQLLLFGVALSCLAQRNARRWLRVLLISVYLFAAAAKLDREFAETLGQQMAGALAQLIGLDASAAPEPLRLALVVAMPAGEAFVGFLLIRGRTRRVGVIAAVALHGAVLLALGPLGLGHQPGVLVWNAVFAAFVWLLFWQRETQQRDDETAPANQTVGWFARVVLAIAIVAPLGSPLGRWDRWPSWGLYAPRGERATVFVYDRAADRLPPSLPIEEPKPGDRWRRVRLGDWLLAETGAPLYPQNRVAAALAAALDDYARLGAYLRVVLESPAGRFDRERESTTLKGADAVRQFSSDHYRINTVSRWTR